MQRLSFLIIVLLGSFFLVACSTTTNPELNEEEIEAYRTEMQTQLEALAQQMTELRAQAEQTGEEMRPEFYETLDSLQTQADQLGAELDILTEDIENTEAWEDIKAGMNTTLQSLEEGYQQVVKEINEES